MGGREGRERGCGSSVRTLEGVVAKVSVQVDGGGMSKVYPVPQPPSYQSLPLYILKNLSVVVQ